ncbi:MAG: hypothetical protein ACM3NT_03625, partial [Methylocystaceae bacterium]
QPTGAPTVITELTFTPTPPAQPPAGDLACFGTNSGIACLGADGWQTFTSDNSSLPAGSFDDIESCPGGRVAAVHSTGVAIYDGKSWQNYTGKSGMLIGASAVACDAQGFWLSYMQGVVHYDGSQYTEYDAQTIDSEASSIFEDIALAPDGTVWAITSSTVSKFDGKAWTTYKQGQGFNESFYFSHIIVDANGTPWVSQPNNALILHRIEVYTKSETVSPDYPNPDLLPFPLLM